MGSVRPYQIYPESRMIPHPCCELCGSYMWFVSIEPEEQPGHDKHTFECPRCQHLTVKMIEHHQNEVEMQTKTSLQ
jgi:hypothetical protein